MNRQQKELYIGLMSGTSADGVDIALCRFTPDTQLLAAETLAWPTTTHRSILDIVQGKTVLDLDKLGHLDTAIGQDLAMAVNAFIDRHNVAAQGIAAIGCHGQTIRHRPDGHQPFTMQWGNPWVLSVQTGIDTIADFRRRDMALGGQGAPLMPAFHAAAFGHKKGQQAIINMGGIANLTVIDSSNRIKGFDTGPANCLMDAWHARHYQQPMDKNGALARQGKVLPFLLEQLLRDPYFHRSPPKSTGREYFSLSWLEQQIDVTRYDTADIQATLLALTAQTVADAVMQHAARSHTLLVCGGGVHNPAMMEALQQKLPGYQVTSTANDGVDPDYMEAMGFAWLARQHVLGLPGNAPSVTGAKCACILGTRYPAT